VIPADAQAAALERRTPERFRNARESVELGRGANLDTGTVPGLEARIRDRVLGLRPMPVIAYT
jgi:hypothetical protein